jgi:ribosome-binding factor A
MDPHRAQRVSEALREELAEIIEYELSDPRLSGVTVTEVAVTPDLKRAHVMITSGGPALEGLEHAKNYLRRVLSSRLRLYRVPELHFEAEDPASPRARVEELLRRVRKTREKKSPPQEK